MVGVDGVLELWNWCFLEFCGLVLIVGYWVFVEVMVESELLLFMLCS